MTTNIARVASPLNPQTAANDQPQPDRPIGVLDIGSNSIRLVVYERHVRSLTSLYNEKASAGLGRGLAASGRLPEDGIAVAIPAIRRFALMARLMQVGDMHILATSAVRDASNGALFKAEVEEIMGAPVRILTGAEEAHFAALGVVAGIPEFRGIVGDLGGGSLELAGLSEGLDSVGETHELGAIRMQDDADMDAAAAVQIATKRLSTSKLLAANRGGVFAAIGGTWRSIAKLHQARTHYPLRMIQHYAVPAGEIIDLCAEIIAADGDGKTLTGMRAVSSSRQKLLPYGAAVLAETLKAGTFETVVFSALGVREGYLYGLLPPAEQAADPLLQATTEMSQLRARSPLHAADLIEFSKKFLDATGVAEAPGEARCRQAACLLSDIGWRGHPDYRGEQSVDLVAYGSMTGVDHPGRAFLAEVLAVRYMGLKHKSVSAAIMKLAGDAANERARLLGALFRVAYPLSAGMPGVLPRLGFALEEDSLVLLLPKELEFIAADRVHTRMNQLASAAGLKHYAIRTV